MKENNRDYLRLFMAIMAALVTITSLILNFRLFDRPSQANIMLLMVAAMSLTFLSVILLLFLIQSQKKEKNIVNLLNDVEKDECDKDEDYEHAFEELQKDIKKIKNNLSNLNSEDLEKIQFENSKNMVFSRIKYNERILRKKINAVCGYFEKPMQSSLRYAIAFAVVGLLPMLFLVVKSGGVETEVDSISCAVIKRWPFFGLTLVVEFVSGVFFKIYYKLVDEIKYYIEENSRITRNAVSLVTLVLLNRFECVDSFAMKMIETQKNRILKKKLMF